MCLFVVDVVFRLLCLFVCCVLVCCVFYMHMLYYCCLRVVVLFLVGVSWGALFMLVCLL